MRVAIFNGAGKPVTIEEKRLAEQPFVTVAPRPRTIHHQVITNSVEAELVMMPDAPVEIDALFTIADETPDTSGVGLISRQRHDHREWVPV